MPSVWLTCLLASRQLPSSLSRVWAPTIYSTVLGSGDTKTNKTQRRTLLKNYMSSERSTVKRQGTLSMTIQVQPGCCGNREKVLILDWWESFWAGKWGQGSQASQVKGGPELHSKGWAWMVHRRWGQKVSSEGSRHEHSGAGKQIPETDAWHSWTMLSHFDC